MMAKSKRVVQHARPGVKRLIECVRKYCEDNDVTVSQLALETGYGGAHYLLSSEPPGYVTTATEAKLREWLQSKREKPAPVAESTTLSIELLQQDPELSLTYALIQVMDHFADVTEYAERRRALSIIKARCLKES